MSSSSSRYLKVAEACWRIFDRQEWLRENRARARIKVLIDKVGIDAFREMVEEELEGDWVAERDFDVERLKFVDDEEANAPPPPATNSSPNGDRSEFDAFVEANVKPQRQQGFSAVEVKVTRGDLTPEQLRGMAAIMREFTGGYARTSAQQNFVLRWVRDESVYDVWERLGELGLGGIGPREITDVVSCPGTDSCKLGITSSMAQHHVANIGFYGASIKVGDRHIPAYIAHLAGNYEGGEIVFGHRLKARLPAKRVPEAVERWVRFYEEERQDGEEFNAFVERVGTDPFEERVKELAMPVEFNLENLDHFMDWSRSEPYKVERGEGECAV